MSLLNFGFQNIELWRSEEMQLVQLMIPSEAAHDTIEALGDVGLLQFKDLNTNKSAFQRTYANQVRRCDEMARRLRFFKEQIEKAHIPVAARSILDGKGPTMDELEAQLETLERELVEVNANHERLQRAANELAELSLMLDCAGKFFDSARREAAGAGPAGASSSQEDFSSPLLDRESTAFDPKSGRLGNIAGLIAREKLPGFERLLFRATRGNLYLRSMAVGQVKDPASGEFVEKAVFVVFFSGERARAKIGKICEAFGANRYPLPEEVNRQRAMAAEVRGRLGEMRTTLEAGDLQRTAVLQRVAASYEVWSTSVRREKAIYHTLNKMSVDVTRKVLVAEAWVPSSARARVQEVLRGVAAASAAQVGAVVQPKLSTSPPPTYFQTNKFTACFQAIVDAYGVARYREVNPTVFTLMTFPFLFAVMFGDFGHGLLMLAFAAYLVLNEKTFLKQQLNEMFGMAFAGRYCILLMALFSIYMGAIYNEFFSMPMSLAGQSAFECVVDGAPVNDPDFDRRDCPMKGGELKMPSGSGPYDFGVDPIWHGTKTELPYLNSLKMKMSILLGVTHMNLGIIMSLFNNNYFRDRLSTWCEFVPQMIFLNALFGYLCILIVAKWLTGSLADLYHVMIYMFLSPGSMDDQGRLFNGQGGVQLLLLLVALAAVPWMLLPKPLVLKARAERVARARGEYHRMADDHEAGGSHGHDDHGHGGHFEFGEVMVHQMIHTIEFVLGAVSNTASYLRLWALSLAHSQLSAVFYDRVLMASIQSGSPAAVVVGFFVFAVATLGVLMVMESLSAFLHALRLHWVEFQNKFYRGDGYAFTPFRLADHQQEADS